MANCTAEFIDANTGSRRCEPSKLSSLLCAIDELTAYPDASTRLRLAVELARERLGLERVGVYLRDRRADRVLLRGTWGTGADGETTDERSLFHEISGHDCETLLQGRMQGGFGRYLASAPLIACKRGRTFVIGEGWVVATPLVGAGAVVGVMYNDAALTHSPMDEGKQAVAAAFCTVLATLLLSKHCTIAWPPLPRDSGQSALVRRVLEMLNDDLVITGEQLARELGVSPGHLARSFKRQMAISLVDYRNQLRMERFIEVMRKKAHGASIVDVALEAGFGSYAQFHRSHRKFTAPRRGMRFERS